MAGWRTETERLWEVEVARFRYLAWGLRGSLAESFVRREEPLAWAFAALMRSRRWRPARHKLECLRTIARSASLDEAHRFLLANCVKTYLQLEADEQAEFLRLLDRDDPEVREMEWETTQEYVERRGKELAIEIGRLNGMRYMVLHLAERRWGDLGYSARVRIGQLYSEDALKDLFDRVLTAASPEEAGLA